MRCVLCMYVPSIAATGRQLRSTPPPLSAVPHADQTERGIHCSFAMIPHTSLGEGGWGRDGKECLEEGNSGRKEISIPLQLATAYVHWVSSCPGVRATRSILRQEKPYRPFAGMAKSVTHSHISSLSLSDRGKGGPTKNHGRERELEKRKAAGRT